MTNYLRTFDAPALDKEEANAVFRIPSTTFPATRPRSAQRILRQHNYSTSQPLLRCKTQHTKRHLQQTTPSDGYLTAAAAAYF
jgi:hypothetical protein